MEEVALAAHTQFHLGPVPITDGVLAGFGITLTLAILVPLLMRGASVIPTRFQVAMEAFMDFMMNLFTGAFGSEERARAFSPLLLSIMIFIAVANQMSFVPFVNQIVLGEHRLFRLPTTDLSATIALALLVFLIAHGIAFSVAPLRHVGDYIRVGHLFHAKTGSQRMLAVIEILLGPLELLSEIAKVLSLSCRLFGNIFAGEVMVGIITGLSTYSQFFVVWPVNLLGILVGFVQAFVFTLLSTLLIANTIRPYLDIRDARLGKKTEGSTELHSVHP
ncbi:MAG: FoF1 ATP synthase subunit a [Candidatus Uhrbacteria bacterium]|jgi:F-type H+-transporting ATPase subunit a